MTERKAFKARVRARAAETGQSYAQAAAQLEAGNPARPADPHPASALVVALLRAEGFELPPALAYGIGGGIGFMYAVFTYRDVDHPLLTIVCQHHPEPWAPAILDRLGIPRTAVTTRTDAAALLSARRPVILPVARATLPWFDTNADSGIVDDREEVVVLAIPDAADFRVSDGSGAFTTLNDETLLSAYARSRRTHPVIALDGAPHLPEDLRPALLSGLRATAAGMLGPVLGNAFDVNFGLSGLEKWGRLADAPGRRGWPALFGDHAVWRRRLIDGIEREHTAPAAGRPLFARTLRLAGMPQPAAAFQRSGRHWRAISHRCQSGTLTFEQLGREVRAIRDIEGEGISALTEAIT